MGWVKKSKNELKLDETSSMQQMRRLYEEILIIQKSGFVEGLVKTLERMLEIR